MSADRSTGIDVEALIENADGSESIFEYRPGTSVLHRLNPVTKLVCSVSLVLIAFSFPEFWGPLVLSVALLSLVLLAGVAKPVLAVVLAIGTPLALSLVIIQGLFYPENETVLISFGVPVIDQLAFFE